jgi:hypothetical protein
VAILETAIGVVIGAVVTVLASRYYFRRSISKRLSVYRLLDSFVFDGITPDVRKELQFRFHTRDVNELQQVVFLVANDGERAIRDVIEPLALTIPHEIEVLDASIMYRQPEGLKADIIVELHAPNSSDLQFTFPLLNKGEFFVVKLLLSGRFRFSSFSVLCDDLPRTITAEPLPADSVQDKEYSFEWIPALIGLGFLAGAAWVLCSAYLLHGPHPELFRPIMFPKPRTIAFAPIAFLYSGVGAVVLLFFAGLGGLLLGLAVFGGEFPPFRGPKFRLSKEIQRMVFPYHALHVATMRGQPRDKETDNLLNKAEGFHGGDAPNEGHQQP